PLEGSAGGRRELKRAVQALESLLRAGRDLGLDPPLVSDRALKYMDAPPRCRAAVQAAAPDQAASLEELRERLGECRRCSLHAGRNAMVFGEGDPGADLVFVGEGPGREEDRAGKPFVGEAGGLLTRIIEAMGLTRGEVYICNVVKCRPPKNRDPRAEEIQACLPFLRRQIELIDPKVICTLGRVAGRELLGREFSMSRDRGRWWRYLGIPVMPTFHPAYLLRNEEAKKPVWEDVKKIMKVLGLGVKRDD
ncbi:MAG: uracil-DNA glycosylase, partial [Desulfobacteraceae bacterium]